MINQGKVFSVEALKARVWDDGSRQVGSTLVVRKYLRTLREKLLSKDHFACIQAIHGVGYRFSPAPEQAD